MAMADLIAMKATLILFTLLFCCFSCFSEERKYSLTSEDDFELALEDLNSQLAPLVIGVLEEAGMAFQNSSEFAEKFQYHTLVEGGAGQIAWNLEKANAILAAMPESIRGKYLSLSYQWVGSIAILRDEVLSHLQITAEQKEILKKIYFDFYEQLAPVNRRDFAYGMTSDQQKSYSKNTEKIMAERDAKMLEVLNMNQKATWSKLLGSPSKALEEFRQYREKYN